MKQFLIMSVSSALLLSAQMLITNAAFAEVTCEQWAGKAVKVQGDVMVRRSSTGEESPLRLNDVLCPGDMITVSKHGRAGIQLPARTLAQLDQGTSLIFTEPEKAEFSLINILRGIVHFMSRTPQALEVKTPFVNAGVEGTEFVISVLGTETLLTVFEGTIRAHNDLGSMIIEKGQSARARTGEPPEPYTVARPRDSVRWALYYLPLYDLSEADIPDEGAPWQSALRESVSHFREGDLSKAFMSLDPIQESVPDHRFYLYRASLLLAVGRVDEAEEDLSRVLGMREENSDALALQSVIAVAQNDKEQAMSLAGRAAAADPRSATAQMAMSYALQSKLDLKGALMSSKNAVAFEPENSLAWARLAEMHQSFGELDRALEAAEKAAALNPRLSRTQTVLGYSYLTQVKTGDARDAFEQAIVLDQADPLPWMGLGLAKIREGKLEEGRSDLEVAAVLDPGNSLARSYLGKAYYEEKEEDFAGDQYAMARELDPKDPTPFFYDAIRKQSMNRPVEALKDMQKAITLNDNRAIYRSKLLLDEDLAARSAAQARIYSDLGFQQLALVEGWKSVNTDPGNYAAHRFLADSYSKLPRHEIARVSELLQSQLLQQINITPVQPSLGESNLLILDGAGPAHVSFNEFNPLFTRNRFSLQASGVMGENHTKGEEIVVSAVQNQFSLSVGQFHYETDGFRENNDLEQNIVNVFGQLNLSHRTSLLAEFRFSEREEGDLILRFDKEGEVNLDPDLRKENDSKAFRLGLRHSFSPQSAVIAHVTLLDGEEEVHNPTPPLLDVDIAVKDEGYMGEFQHLFTSDMVHITSGAGYYGAEEDFSLLATLVNPPFPPIPLEDSFSEADVYHANLYVYAHIFIPYNISLTLGGSGDFYDDEDIDKDQFNPKLGVIWNPLPDTTVRAAAFRTLKRTLASDQTIEPTEVAGFNQFFDDSNGADAWRYGIAIDQKFSELVSGGIEYSQRDIEVSFLDFVMSEGDVVTADWDEKQARAYLYAALTPWLALRAEYLYEKFERDDIQTGEEQIRDVDTHRVPLEISLFHPSGFSARFTATYTDQDGEFGDDINGFFSGRDRFWVADAELGYRLPRRYGLIRIGIKNIFDEEFQFQDTDLAKQTIYPERFVYGRVSLSF